MIGILLLFSVLTIVAIRFYKRYVVLHFPVLIKSNLISVSIASGCGAVLWDVFCLEALYLYLYQGISHLFLIALFLPSLIFTFFGWLDDLIEFSPKHKLFYQIVLAMCSVNIFLYLEKISISFSGVIFLVFLLVWLVNSINFIDILDGLASGIVILILSTFLIIFKIKELSPLFLVTIFLLIPFIIFFLHNAYRPSVYLGDAGAHLSGCLLFFIALKFYFLTPIKGEFNFSLLAIFSFLIFDFLYVCFIRWRNSKSLFMKSNDHQMFLILNMTGSKIVTLVLMLAMQLFSSIIALLIL